MSNDRTAELIAMLKEAERYCPVHVQDQIRALLKKAAG